MINRSKLLDLLLDNQELTDQQLVKEIEDFLANNVPYDHSNINVQGACKISLTGDSMKELDEITKTSEKIEAAEKMFSKRELAYLFVSAVMRIGFMKDSSELKDTLLKSVLLALKHK